MDQYNPKHEKLKSREHSWRKFKLLVTSTSCYVSVLKSSDVNKLQLKPMAFWKLSTV